MRLLVAAMLLTACPGAEEWHELVAQGDAGCYERVIFAQEQLQQICQACNHWTPYRFADEKGLHIIYVCEQWVKQ